MGLEPTTLRWGTLNVERVVLVFVRLLLLYHLLLIATTPGRSEFIILAKQELSRQFVMRC